MFSLRSCFHYPRDILKRSLHVQYVFAHCWYPYPFECPFFRRAEADAEQRWILFFQFSDNGVSIKTTEHVVHEDGIGTGREGLFDELVDRLLLLIDQRGQASCRDHELWDEPLKNILRIIDHRDPFSFE